MGDPIESEAACERRLARVHEDRRKAARFRRSASLAVLLCAFGVGTLAMFLGYRHLHPPDLSPIVIERFHTCPHDACRTGHESLERQTEHAPTALAILLFIYCGVVGIGAFVVDQ